MENIICNMAVRARRSGVTQTGHLDQLSDRGARPFDRRHRAEPADRLRRRAPVRHLGRDLPGGRLGADDRHHPEGRLGPLHGHVERRDRIGGRPRGRSSAGRHGPRRWATTWCLAPRSGMAVASVRPRCAAPATSRRAAPGGLPVVAARRGRRCRGRLVVRARPGERTLGHPAPPGRRPEEVERVGLAVEPGTVAHR